MDGRRCADRADAVERLNAVLKAELAHASAETARRTLGTYRGLRLALETRHGQHSELLVGGAAMHFLEFRAPAAGGC